MQHSTTIQKMVLPNRIFFTEVIGLLEQGHPVTLLAKGNSMTPFIRGDIDEVVLRKPETLSKGDIVLASVDGHGYVLHRIMRIDSDYVRLMGDGNLRQMEQCKPDDIVGKVTHIIRNGKQIDCNAPKERLKAEVWRLLLPLRRGLLFLFRRWNKKTGCAIVERSGYAD